MTDQERENAMAALQAAITEGGESGTPQPFDAAVFKQRMRKKHLAGEHHTTGPETADL